MDNFIFDDNTMINITNGLIQDVTTERNTTFVTVSYRDYRNRNRGNQTVRLVVGRNTLIIDEFGNRMRPSELKRGMRINATISSVMTRSNPPQANAFLIRVISRQIQDRTTVGRIINVDRQNRHFTTISDGNPSSAIRFNITMNTRFFDIAGRPINFSRLMPGLRVRVRHASFMTASIPPQTTAFEVRVLR